MINALGYQVLIDGPGEALKCCVHMWSVLLIPMHFRRTNTDLWPHGNDIIDMDLGERSDSPYLVAKLLIRHKHAHAWSCCTLCNHVQLYMLILMVTLDIYSLASKCKISTTPSLCTKLDSLQACRGFCTIVLHFLCKKNYPNNSASLHVVKIAFEF